MNDKLTTSPAAPTEAHLCSEAKLRLLVQSVRDYAIFMLDETGVIESWNEGAQRLKGYRAGEIIGRHFSVFYPPEDIVNGKPDWELKTALQQGSVEDEGWRLRKDGSRFWASVVITALRDNDGRHVGFAKVTRDLTERRQADEALRQSELRLRTMIESVEDYAIFMLDPQGKVVTWNIGGQRLKGYTAAEAIGLHFSRFYPPEDVASGRPALQLERAARLGRVEDEGWRVRKDGSRFWAYVVITALRDSAGRLSGFAKVTRDVTERHEMEEALRAAKDDLEARVAERTSELTETNRELEEFAYVTSHDLQEPIRKVLIYSEMLQSELKALPPHQASLLEKIVNAGSRLRNIVQDLLTFSRLTRAPAARERLSLHAVVKEATEDIEVQISETGAAITIDRLPWTEGNPAQLRHVFQNLISNAIKFRRPGGKPEIRVFEVPASGAGSVAVAVADNGIGFDPSYNEKIFAPFQRLHTRNEYEGTGIGLSIVKKIVTQHGGRVEARSAPGQGATFVVELPAAPRAA